MIRIFAALTVILLELGKMVHLLPKVFLVLAFETPFEILLGEVACVLFFDAGFNSLFLMIVNLESQLFLHLVVVVSIVMLRHINLCHFFSVICVWIKSIVPMQVTSGLLANRARLLVLHNA